MVAYLPANLIFVKEKQGPTSHPETDKKDYPLPYNEAVEGRGFV